MFDGDFPEVRQSFHMHHTSDDHWPERLLRRNSVAYVHVCGQRCAPPVLSYVVNFPRLEIPLAGCYENQIETDAGPATVRLKPGEALFAPPNCWNLPTWKHPVQLLSLLFGRRQIGMSFVTLKSTEARAFVVKKSSLPRPPAGPLFKLLEAMAEVRQAGGPAAALPELAQALLCFVRESVLHPDDAAANPAGSLLDEVCVYLQNNYQHAITREGVAAQFGISPNSLSRVFQQQGNMTFTDYLMHVRMDRAKHLLKSYNLKLDEVAARCGYHDAAYFCRVFRRMTKLTPGEYRAQFKSATANTEPA